METALITALVTLTVAYLTQFVAEQYRRFRDGSALAAGIAGELASYRGAQDLIQSSFGSMKEAISQGRRSSLRFRGTSRPTDVYFPKVVEKIGLLGPELCERIIFVYSQLAMFREAFFVTVEQHAQMNDEELLRRLTICEEAIGRAFAAGVPLVESLQARSEQSFVKTFFASVPGVRRFSS